MAYSYTWPNSLPQSPQKGFTESGGVLIARTPMDAGPAKQRRKGKKPSTLSLTFIMTTQQVADLKNFAENTLSGTARFGFTHPRTGTIEEVRILPSNDGDLYSFSYIAPGFYNVSLQLEVLP